MRTIFYELGKHVLYINFFNMVKNVCTESLTHRDRFVPSLNEA